MFQRKLSEHSKDRSQRASWLAAFAAAALLGCLNVNAQETKERAPAATANGEAAVVTTINQKPPGLPVPRNVISASTADRYRIGPGDVLDIRIVNRPNLSRDNVRVEGDGTIRMPLIEGSIQAACLTESELSKQITTGYLKFYRNAQVDVFIKEYRSTQVAILGQVNDQSRFMLQRRIKLLELLTYAKGPTAQAGQTINVIHSDTAFQCVSDPNKDEINAGLSSYRLAATLQGDEKANPYLENGDIVTLPEADQVYVVGNVLTPRFILLKEPVTLTRAIAMSGGLAKDTKKDKIRIVRQEPGSPTKKEIYVDLSAIEKKQAEDIALVANDIVDVPVSGTKSMIRSVVTGLGTSATQMPLRVIP